ncbi:hypothetical protein [Pelagicoccus sp. SDUM812003]|uniref:hypothetical protein n=1 Tax=Pelagicoccus sp. SDUM812003 TaxID=3041267 RepID=UPI00280C51DC|nr:hypothetical protein [Pelagicoccus sp. SDUM812003]MDQ8204799.1 hypothetical protein [Pelagicoccus sp. SDUM812003]
MPAVTSKKPFLAAGLTLALAAGIGLGLYLGQSGSEGGSERSAFFPADKKEIETILNIPKPKAPKSEYTVARSDRNASETASSSIDALDGLNDPRTSIRSDIRLLDHLMAQTHTVFHELPIGDNREITAFLQGDNPRGIEYLSESDPSVNTDGEIVDRWGTPFFFHALSRHQMEIRSAGPDKLHWSEDDIVSETVESQSLARF